MTPTNPSCGSARSSAVEIATTTKTISLGNMNTTDTRNLPGSVQSLIDKRREELVISVLDAAVSARIARDMNDSITDMAFIASTRQAVVKAKRFSSLVAYEAFQNHGGEVTLLDLVRRATDIGDRTQELLGAALNVRDECSDQQAR